MLTESTSTKNVYAALLKFQDDCPPIPRKGVNTFHKNKYVLFDDALEITRPILSKYGLVVTQPTAWVDGILVLYTRIKHAASDEFIQSAWPILPVKPDPQGMAAANTYGRRNAYMSSLGLAPSDDDDDGNIASDKGKNERLANQLKSTPPPRVAEDIPPPTDEYDTPPEQRANSLGDFVFKLNGPDKGKTFRELGRTKLEGHIKFWSSRAATPERLEFLDNARVYLAE